MAETTTHDLVIIGGGPAGYVGAIRAAQLGMSVACVERDKLGGICLNWGCIPTKALLAGAEFYAKLKHDAEKWGILADNIRHDWTKVIGRSRGVADNLNRGIHGLFKKHKITHVQGVARIAAAGRVEVRDPASVQAIDAPVKQLLNCKNILIATGAVPRQLPDAPFDGQKILSFKEAMSLPQQPKSLVVIGAGAIGMEFAYFYNAFGTKVTVIELLDRVLPVEDEEVSKAVARSFVKQGIDCRPGHRSLSVKASGEGVEVVVAPVAEPEKTETLKAEKVLVAIGVRGRYEGLFADTLKVETLKDHIKVDYRKPDADYQTSVKGIYAVGDVIGPPWLAHVASEEAIVCVERLAGHRPQPINYDAIPGCTYCQPQVASIGQTEQALRQRDLKPGEHYKVGKFPFSASGKAQAIGATEGFVKILSDAKTGEILGVHMVGEGVTELIAELSLAKRAELTVDEIIAAIHAHPTLSEAVHEATLGVHGRMIHF